MFAASIVNIFTDFLTTVVPMPLIWRLKLPSRQRLAVIGIFGLGVMVNVAGSVRTYYVWKAMIESYDQTWYAWPIAMAGSIEINLGVVRSIILDGRNLFYVRIKETAADQIAHCKIDLRFCSRSPATNRLGSTSSFPIHDWDFKLRPQPPDAETLELNQPFQEFTGNYLVEIKRRAS